MRSVILSPTVRGTGQSPAGCSMSVCVNLCVCACVSCAFWAMSIVASVTAIGYHCGRRRVAMSANVKADRSIWHGYTTPFAAPLM